MLPRLLLLLAHTPPSCPVLTAVDGFVTRFLELLPSELQSRILPWQGLGHVHYARALHVVAEAPYCHARHAHGGRIEVLALPEAVQLLRSTFVAPTLAEAVRWRRAQAWTVAGWAARVASWWQGTPSSSTLILQRKGARAYQQHDELVRALEARGGRVDVFDASGPLSEHIRAFARATVIIGTHGAGMANLVFCTANATVVEIGWDSGLIAAIGEARTAAALRGERVAIELCTSAPRCDKWLMEMDDDYARVALSMGLRYRLVVGVGEYRTNISAPVERVLDAAFSTAATLVQPAGRRERVEVRRVAAKETCPASPTPWSVARQANLTLRDGNARMVRAMRDGNFRIVRANASCAGRVADGRVPPPAMPPPLPPPAVRPPLPPPCERTRGSACLTPHFEIDGGRELLLVLSTRDQVDILV